MRHATPISRPVFMIFPNPYLNPVINARPAGSGARAHRWLKK